MRTRYVPLPSPQVRHLYEPLRAVDDGVVGYVCKECGRLHTAPHLDTCSLAPKQPEFPEHEKLKTMADKSQACGEFLEWLQMQGYVIARYHEHGDLCARGCIDERLHPATPNIPALLAEHFGIDQNRLEAEKRAMLDQLRAVHKGKL
jgi:hypothetical protein